VIKTGVENKTTGRENLVKATDGLYMNNSRHSEGYRTEGLTEPPPGIPRIVGSQNRRYMLGEGGHMRITPGNR